MPYKRKATKKPIGKMAGYMGKKEPQKKKVPGVKTGVSKAPKYKASDYRPKKKRQKALTKPKIKKKK